MYVQRRFGVSSFWLWKHAHDYYAAFQRSIVTFEAVTVETGRLMTEHHPTTGTHSSAHHHTTQHTASDLY